MTQPQLENVYRMGEHVLCALSGGADSVALLFLLKYLRDEGRIVLSAAHFEHGIRGQASKEDAVFAHDLCERLNIPFYMASADVPALARARRMGIEAAAREARYAFLLDTADRIGAQAIALAHHQDDQAETVLMHLMRGSGMRGLSGMRARDGRMTRPLLQYTKKDLVLFLQEIGENWREDATNAQDNTPRNALRLHVVPALKRIYPGAERALCRYASIAAEQDDYLCAEASKWLENNISYWPFGFSLTSSPVHPALLGRVLALIFGSNADFAQIERLKELYFQPKGALALAGGWRAERVNQRLYFIDGCVTPPRGEALLHDGIEMEGLGLFFVKKTDPVPVRDDRWTQVLDARALEGAVVRTRRPGDRIHPLGAPGTRLLSDYLIDRKIDRPLRDYLPLVAKTDRILWAVGVGISQEAALQGGEALKIIFQRRKNAEKYQSIKYMEGHACIRTWPECF